MPYSPDEIFDNVLTGYLDRSDEATLARRIRDVFVIESSWEAFTNEVSVKIGRIGVRCSRDEFRAFWAENRALSAVRAYICASVRKCPRGHFTSDDPCPDHDIPTDPYP